MNRKAIGMMTVIGLGVLFAAIMFIFLNPVENIKNPIGLKQYDILMANELGEAAQSYIDTSADITVQQAKKEFIKGGGVYEENSISPCGKHIYPLYNNDVYDCTPDYFQIYSAYFNKYFTGYLNGYGGLSISGSFVTGVEQEGTFVKVDGKSTSKLRVPLGMFDAGENTDQLSGENSADATRISTVLGAFGDEKTIACKTGNCFVEGAELYLQAYNSLALKYKIGGSSPYTYQKTIDDQKKPGSIFEGIQLTQSNTPGFDGAGFIWWVSKHTGIPVLSSRKTANEYYELVENELLCTDCTNTFIESNAQIGDILFSHKEENIVNHMMIYAGDGYIIHMREGSGLIKEKLSETGYSLENPSVIVGVYRPKFAGDVESIYGSSGKKLLFIGDSQTAKAAGRLYGYTEKITGYTVEKRLFAGCTTDHIGKCIKEFTDECKETCDDEKKTILPFDVSKYDVVLFQSGASDVTLMSTQFAQAIDELQKSGKKIIVVDTTPAGKNDDETTKNVRKQLHEWLNNQAYNIASAYDDLGDNDRLKEEYGPEELNAKGHELVARKINKILAEGKTCSISIDFSQIQDRSLVTERKPVEQTIQDMQGKYQLMLDIQKKYPRVPVEVILAFINTETGGGNYIRNYIANEGKSCTGNNCPTCNERGYCGLMQVGSAACSDTRDMGCDMNQLRNGNLDLGLESGIAYLDKLRQYNHIDPQNPNWYWVAVSYNAGPGSAQKIMDAVIERIKKQGRTLTRKEVQWRDVTFADVQTGLNNIGESWARDPAKQEEVWKYPQLFGLALEQLCTGTGPAIMGANGLYSNSNSYLEVEPSFSSSVEFDLDAFSLITKELYPSLQECKDDLENCVLEKIKTFNQNHTGRIEVTQGLENDEVAYDVVEQMLDCYKNNQAGCYCEIPINKSSRKRFEKTTIEFRDTGLVYAGETSGSSIDDDTKELVTALPFNPTVSFNDPEDKNKFTELFIDTDGYDKFEFESTIDDETIDDEMVLAKLYAPKCSTSVPQASQKKKVALFGGAITQQAWPQKLSAKAGVDLTTFGDTIYTPENVMADYESLTEEYDDIILFFIPEEMNAGQQPAEPTGGEDPPTEPPAEQPLSTIELQQTITQIKNDFDGRIIVVTPLANGKEYTTQFSQWISSQSGIIIVDANKELSTNGLLDQEYGDDNGLTEKGSDKLTELIIDEAYSPKKQKVKVIGGDELIPYLQGKNIGEITDGEADYVIIVAHEGEKARLEQLFTEYKDKTIVVVTAFPFTQDVRELNNWIKQQDVTYIIDAYDDFVDESGQLKLLYKGVGNTLSGPGQLELADKIAGAFIATCQPIVDFAKRYVGPKRYGDAGRCSPEAAANGCKMQCGSFVGSVYQFGAQTWVGGNGNMICDNIPIQISSPHYNFLRYSKDTSTWTSYRSDNNQETAAFFDELHGFLQPGDILSTTSPTSAGVLYGHTGIYVGRGRLENKVGNNCYSDYVPDPNGDYIIIHNTGWVCYSSLKEFENNNRMILKACRNDICEDPNNPALLHLATSGNEQYESDELYSALDDGQKRSAVQWMEKPDGYEYLKCKNNKRYFRFRATVGQDTMGFAVYLEDKIPPQAKTLSVTQDRCMSQGRRVNSLLLEWSAPKTDEIDSFKGYFVSGDVTPPDYDDEEPDIEVLPAFDVRMVTALPKTSELKLDQLYVVNQGETNHYYYLIDALEISSLQGDLLSSFFGIQLNPERPYYFAVRVGDEYGNEQEEHVDWKQFTIQQTETELNNPQDAITSMFQWEKTLLLDQFTALYDTQCPLADPLPTLEGLSGPVDTPPYTVCPSRA